MYERLATLYAAGRMTADQLDVAVLRGWITPAQRDTITQAL